MLPSRLGPHHRAHDQPSRAARRALIRPGRIDLEIELGNATASQLKNLFLRFYPDAAERAARLAADYPPKSISPARIQQVLIAADSLAEAVRGCARRSRRQGIADWWAGKPPLPPAGEGGG